MESRCIFKLTRLIELPQEARKIHLRCPYDYKAVVRGTCDGSYELIVSSVKCSYGYRRIFVRTSCDNILLNVRASHGHRVDIARTPC